MDYFYSAPMAPFYSALDNSPLYLALLALDRFAGRIRRDDKGNAAFPHFDEKGLSGYELKNVGFTGFASGGKKALWLSQEFPTITGWCFVKAP